MNDEEVQSWDTIVRYSIEIESWGSITRYSHEIQSWGRIVRYSREIQSWDTVERYSHEIQSWDTVMRYSHAIQSWDTVMRYSREIQSWDTVVRYSREIQSWDTVMRYSREIVMRYSREIQSWDTVVRYSHEIQSWDTVVRYSHEIQSWALTLGLRYRWYGSVLELPPQPVTLETWALGLGRAEGQCPGVGVGRRVRLSLLAVLVQDQGHDLLTRGRDVGIQQVRVFDRLWFLHRRLSNINKSIHAQKIPTQSWMKTRTTRIETKN